MKYFYETLDLIEINSITTNFFRANSFKAKIIKILAFMVYKNAFKLYVMHREFKKYLISLGIDKEKVKIIYYGSNISQTVPKSTELIKLKENLGLKQEKILGWFGYFAPHKGILEQLIPAMNLIQKRIPEYKLLLIGDGPIKNRINRKIQELNLRKEIISLNWVDYKKISSYYLISDIILITTSLTESERYMMPIKLYDALNLGRCVIVAESPSLSNLFQEKKHLIYCKPGDPNDLAKKIIELIQNPDLMETIRKEGQKFAQKHFDIKKNTKKWL
jgi:glycosyltransferase involved in cell wall biosynthesis